MLYSRNLVQTKPSVENFNSAVVQLNNQIRGEYRNLSRLDYKTESQFESIQLKNYQLYAGLWNLLYEATVLQKIQSKYMSLSGRTDICSTQCQTTQYTADIWEDSNASI